MRFTFQLLKSLKVSGTSVSSLSICNYNLEKGKKAEDNTSSEYFCDELVHFQYLDIRNNQLSHLKANGLPNLHDVYLSGMSILNLKAVALFMLVFYNSLQVDDKTVNNFYLFQEIVGRALNTIILIRLTGCQTLHTHFKTM